ncbi:ECF transporter S component [Acetobacterium paludosum]|uniref:ECF transporter S component n=1 Tax=Acetobacterium paludosum TaxID=52693 RepID=A0A923KWC5_9FIRM|nr:ECF transporter S component [Acetobacterium paludosum]MBC3887913.1 ECF transporter S component [Acetobacterium paludosum]
MKKRRILSFIITFLLVPLTIWFGIAFFGDRKYLIISILIIFYSFIPFSVSFESRKPDARELVVIAVMAGIAACGNLAFFMIGPFQAGTALVIIAGICLGPEQGFLTGAMARLVINIFAGQGPWTPWQMFCWGLLGFLGGICFNRNEEFRKKDMDFKVVFGPIICVLISLLLGLTIHILTNQTGTFWGWQLYAYGALGLLLGTIFQHQRLPADRGTIAVFGFLTTFVIYGGIMNVAALVMSVGVSGSGMELDWSSLKLLYLSGVPYDCVHALGTCFFGALLGPVMIEKLDRVKLKFGLYQ